MTVWRWVEWAEKLTIRAHCAFRSSGSAERTQCTMPITPSSNASRHCSSVSSSNVPRVPGPTALMRMLSPPFHQPFGRAVENLLGAADECHPRTIFGEAARGRESHPATTADDDRGGVL